MNWLRENRFAFPITSGICALCAIYFLFDARADWRDASTRFALSSAALMHLERSAPYPNEENLRQVIRQADAYEVALTRLKDELKGRVLRCPPLAPNEFQSRLRVAVTAVVEKARKQGVRLPDRFHLGFDEYASGLPNEMAAPLLGQELAQVEWILDVLIEAGVDSLVSFRRTPLPEEQENGPAPLHRISGNKRPGALPLATPGLLERNVVEVTFVSAPAAVRQVLNQVAGASEQLFIVRLLHVRNEQGKGPPREIELERGGGGRAMASPVPVGARASKSPSDATLHFIVGDERIETNATIEIVRFPF